MTGDPGHPRLPLDLLADLHAGALDERTAAELRPRVAADPAARAVLAALDATVADLSGAATMPAPRMPDEVAARIERALAAEAGAARGTSPTPARTGQASVVDLGARRRRRRGLLAGGLVAAAAAAVGVVAIGGLSEQTGGVPQAEAPASQDGPDGPGVPTLSADDLGGSVRGLIGSSDYGPLDDPDVLDGCLTANGVPANVRPIGAREVTLDGAPAVALILPGGEIGRFRVLVVGPGCGPGEPALLAEDTVGS